MRQIKFIFVSLLMIGLSLLLLAATNIKPEQNVPEKGFADLQHELNRDKHKNKVISRFAELEGWKGLALEQITLELVDFSYHYLNDSGRKIPFVTVKCHIDISDAEKRAVAWRAQLISEGRPGNLEIGLPDAERTILGLLDDNKDEFITFTALPGTVKASVQFAELRKDKPEYIILTLEPDEDCSECWQKNSYDTMLFGFDERSRSYVQVLAVPTYKIIQDYDDLDSGVGYEDLATISWSKWINDQYRELIVTTERNNFVTEKNVRPAFKSKQEFYSWGDGRELILVERIVDGNVTLSRRGPTLPPPDVILKAGELYFVNGNDVGDRITVTGGKIDEYLVSPDKRFVAFLVITGYTDDPGLYEDDEVPPQVPLHKLVVFDLLRKKQLREITAPSKNDPFLRLGKWLSDHELMLHDADGFSVSWFYVYNAEINDLRKASVEESDTAP